MGVLGVQPYAFLTGGAATMRIGPATPINMEYQMAGFS